MTYMVIIETLSSYVLKVLSMSLTLKMGQVYVNKTILVFRQRMPSTECEAFTSMYHSGSN